MKDLNLKIILTGAQGTGKTTLLNRMKAEGWDVITEVVRKMSKEGVKINKNGDADGQTKIFNKYAELIGDAETSIISDRGLTDVMAYTAYLTHHDNTKENEELFQGQYLQWLAFTKNHPEVMYFYVPIEFPAEDDGVRDTDENYRSEIDNYIKLFFETSKVPFVELRGTVEERLNILKNSIEIVKANLLAKTVENTQTTKE